MNAISNEPDPSIASTQHFNRRCAGVALLWLLSASVLGQWLRPNPLDFGQFYMGGVVALHGAWEALYPIPLSRAWKNPGEPDTSMMRQRYAELAEARGVGNTNRFMQFPPNALLYAPFALLPYHPALVAWTGVMALCGWVVALQAGWMYAMLAGRPTRVAGVIVLVMAFSPTIFRAVRAGQVSPLVGLCIGATALALSGRADVRGAAVMSLGALIKYATLALLPLAVLLGRWRMVAAAAALGIGVTLLTLAVTGPAPFAEYFTEIAPRLNRSHPWDGNQSLQAFLLRSTSQQPLSQTVMLTVRVAQYATLCGLLALLVSRRLLLRDSLPHQFAAAAALVAWMLIFSPIAWYHYYPYLFPFWGWLAWEAQRGRVRTAAVVLIVLLAIWPWCASPRLNLPEPFNSHLLWSTVLLLGLAVRSLASSQSASELERVAGHHHRSVLADVQQ
ncbi:MAG TPA: glycosyltransferase family 87 protein [Tepidisphaeraceae bacterium]|nr:glycosyltransferase family 87 protein [Tepidisphaeraceae bacterium]